MTYNNGTDTLKKFAAYLNAALEHKRAAYCARKAKRIAYERSLESYLECVSPSEETDYLEGLRLEDQVGDSRLQRILPQLSSLDHQILYFHVLQKLPYDEVAEQVHCNRWTVKSRYLRMLKKFRNT